MSERNAILNFGRALLRWLDRLRRVLHFLLLLGMFAILVAVLSPVVPVVPDSAALIVDPSGAIVDQLSGDPLERAIAAAQGAQLQESLLRDLIDSVRGAVNDERIKALVLDLDGMTAVGLSKLEELAAAIDGFRETGKPVFAVGSAFDRDQYYLAARADEIFLHPMGLVLVEGYAAYIPYYRSALDKLYIDYNVWTVGEFKSFVEPITRDDMSPEDREARSVYLDAMWRHYQQGVTPARGLPADAMQRYADDFVTLLRGAGGDAAQLALDYGLVDEVLAYDEMDARIREVVGSADDSDIGYAAIDYLGYLAAMEAVDFGAASEKSVAVIVAAGEILDGRQPPGTVGAESLVRLIRAAREDERTGAVVLRVDSPGGSAFASELIRRELELLRESGRPLVVSMGSVAASGGYWIAMVADEIWASPATLTGSIGVGATFPTFPRTLNAVGVNIDGLGTTRLSGQSDPLQGIGEDIDAYVGLSIRQTYDEFIGKVAEHRGLELTSVEESARGRVWIGGDALERGLVDRLGNLDEAIEAAAALAELAEGEYDVDFVEPELGFAEQLALEFVEASGSAFLMGRLVPEIPESIRDALAVLEDPLLFGGRLNDPRGIYAYCFCDVR